jgi:hypothetical protein
VRIMCELKPVREETIHYSEVAEGNELVSERTKV